MDDPQKIVFKTRRVAANLNLNDPASKHHADLCRYTPLRIRIGVCTLSGVEPKHRIPIEAVELANGSMSFDRVCREWRCKYTGDKSDSKSLESIAGVLEEYLPELKTVSSDATVNSLVCGSCLDFKLMTTVPLADFGPWQEKGF